MTKFFKRAFISIFIVLFLCFFLKWLLNGSDFIWNTYNQFDLFISSASSPIQQLINQFQSIGVSESFFDTFLNIIKTIGLAIILPFRLGGVILVWLFS